jgi:hypothetical protein
MWLQFEVSTEAQILHILIFRWYMKPFRLLPLSAVENKGNL